MKERYSKDNLSRVVEESKSIAEVCRGLGIGTKGRNFYTVKKYITFHGLSTEHFQSREDQLKALKFNNTTPLEDILVIDSTYNSNHGLKKKLLKAGLLSYECQNCGNKGEWNGTELILQLDHINGVNNDNRLENLRFLCPNCHSQTETYCGKHTSAKARKKEEREINGGLTNKEKTVKIKSRKVERPPYEQLLKEVNKFGFSAIGRKYGVSDNSIRKWIKWYEKVEN